MDRFGNKKKAAARKAKAAESATHGGVRKPGKGKRLGAPKKLAKEKRNSLTVTVPDDVRYFLKRDGNASVEVERLARNAMRRQKR